MHKDNSNKRVITKAGITALVLLIPFLGLGYLLFPDTEELEVFGYTANIYSMYGWYSWNSFVFYVSHSLLIALIPIVLISKYYLLMDWYEKLIVYLVLSMALYFLIKTLAVSPLASNHEIVLSLLLVAVVISVVILLMRWKKPTWRERYEQVVTEKASAENKEEYYRMKLKSLSDNEIRNLAVRFTNLSTIVKLMDTHQDVTRWREVLAEEAALGKADLEAAFIELNIEFN